MVHSHALYVQPTKAILSLLSGMSISDDIWKQDIKPDMPVM